MHIGMIYTQNPNKPDLFATYLLALHLPGVTSYKDLRSLNRPNDVDYDPSQDTIICTDAVEAASRRGLLTTDEKWSEVMDQVACVIQNSRRFVEFFVQLLLFSVPSDPHALFQKYLDRLLAPRRPGVGDDRDRRTQRLLRDIRRILELNDRTMADFGLPEPTGDERTLAERVDEDLIPPVFDDTGEPLDMSRAQRSARAHEMYVNCYPEQQAFIDLVRRRVEELRAPPTSNEVVNLLLLQGEAGTGKTHALNVLIEHCHAESIPLRASASTGIAATRLLGGTTVHSLFGVIVEEDDDSPSSSLASRVSPDSYKGRLLKRTSVFIIDEVGMLHIDVIEVVNTLLKLLHDTSVRFGRVLMIFTGDARQIMPIVHHADPLGRRQAEASFFFSGHRTRCEVVTLQENRRLRAGQGFFLDWQRKLGMDRYQHVQFQHDTRNELTRYICIPRKFARYDEEAFIREVFSPEVLSGPPMALSKRVLLAPTNRIVNSFNARIARLMPSDRHTVVYLSTNMPAPHNVYDPTTAVMAPENLQAIESPRMPSHRLELKVGMPVMCMQNINVSNGICNGSQMVVERLDPAVVWCRVNSRYGEIVHPFAATNFTYRMGILEFTRSQLPLRIAFSATINRAQGGTYEKVGFDSRHPVWAHGQSYTVVSRVEEDDGLIVLCDHRKDYTHNGEVLPTMRNVVHPWVSARFDHLAGPQPADGPSDQPPHLPPAPGPGPSADDMYDGPEFHFYDSHPSHQVCADIKFITHLP
jgi:hypothetical protein